MNELSPFAKVSYLEYFYFMKYLQGTDRAQQEMITRCLDDTLLGAEFAGSVSGFLGRILRANKGFLGQFAAFGPHLTPNVNFLIPGVYPIEKGLVLGYERGFYS
jgi:hypothetical protein